MILWPYFSAFASEKATTMNPDNHHIPTTPIWAPIGSMLFMAALAAALFYADKLGWIQP